MRQYRITGHLRGFLWPQTLKWGITLTIVVFSLFSCTYGVSFSKKAVPKLEYHEIEFESCQPEISGYLCVKNNDAIKSVLDFKNCQEQNKLLREILDGK
tara:strand:+ start:174 stop:470 length:297 start_codon:yes stop_codon:yes gene_type:complete